MPGICYVSNITHFVTQMHQVTVYEIECDEGPGMAQVTLPAYGGAADVHADVTRGNGFKNFFLSRVGVINF